MASKIKDKTKPPAEQPKTPSDGKLRFLARCDVNGKPLLQSVPNTRMGVRYIGRSWDKKRERFVATDQPYAAERHSSTGQRLIKLHYRDKSIYPADAFTAGVCGVHFIPTTLKDGERVPVKE